MPSRHNERIKFVIALSFFMEAMDSTVINTAVPEIAKSFHVHAIDLKIALISYLVSLAVFIPISGWIADKFGAKKVFIVALTIFTISSTCCGFATNLPQLIVARLCQGLGGALGLPVGRLIIVRHFQREQFIIVMNHIVTIAAIGLMLGPAIGGFITYYLSWHWIFWINIPVGILAIVLTHYCLPFNLPHHPPPLDIRGFLYFGIGLSAFNFGLSAISESLFSGLCSVMILVLAITLLIVYWFHSKHQQHPIVKTDLLTIRTFRVSVLGNLMSRIGFGGIPFVLPLMFQMNLNFTPQHSGLLLTPIALGVLFSKRWTIHLLRLFNYRKFLVANTLLASLSIALFGMIDEHSSDILIAFLTGIYGFFISLQYSGMNSLAYADLAKEKLSSATSIMSTLQQIAISMGVALTAMVLHFTSLSLSENRRLDLTVFHITFYVLSIVTLCSTIIFLKLKENDGHQMIK